MWDNPVEPRPGLTRKGLVVLVEDDLDHARLILAGLEASPRVGQVKVIADGERALDFIRVEGATPSAAGLPDLVLLDLKLPRVDGLDVLRALRASPGWSAVPVVVLTTSNRPADIEACLANGANAYVTKASPVGLVAKAAELAEEWLRHRGQ